MLPSFEERSVWVQLVGLVLAFAASSIVSGIMLARGVDTLVPFIPVFAVSVLLLIVLLAVGHVIAAVIAKPEPRDERDRLIGWRAESNSSWLLGVGVFGALVAITLQASTIWVVHALIASLYASEILKLSLQATYYRRGT